MYVLEVAPCPGNFYTVRGYESVFAEKSSMVMREIERKVNMDSSGVCTRGRMGKNSVGCNRTVSLVSQPWNPLAPRARLPELLFLEMPRSTTPLVIPRQYWAFFSIDRT